MQPRTSLTEFETETLGHGMRGEGSQLSLLSFSFSSSVQHSRGCYFANYKRKKKTQAKQIKAIREITPGTKRPEVNRGEALSK